MRITRGSELTACLDAGRRQRTRHLDLVWRHNASGHARLGLIVPLRRRLREILRRDVLRNLPAVDLVIRAKRSAYTASFAVLRAELTGAVETLP